MNFESVPTDNDEVTAEVTANITTATTTVTQAPDNFATTDNTKDSTTNIDTPPPTQPTESAIESVNPDFGDKTVSESLPPDVNEITADATMIATAADIETHDDVPTTDNTKNKDPTTDTSDPTIDTPPTDAPISVEVTADATIATAADIETHDDVPTTDNTNNDDPTTDTPPTDAPSIAISAVTQTHDDTTVTDDTKNAGPTIVTMPPSEPTDSAISVAHSGDATITFIATMDNTKDSDVAIDTPLPSLPTDTRISVKSTGDAVPIIIAKRVNTELLPAVEDGPHDTESLPTNDDVSAGDATMIDTTPDSETHDNTATVVVNTEDANSSINQPTPPQPTDAPIIHDDPSFQLRASLLPIAQRQNISSFSWVENKEDTFYMNGIHTAPLSAFKHLFDEVKPKLSHLFARVYNNQRPRFVVDFFNTDVVYPKNRDPADIPSPQMYRLGNVAALYHSIFIADGKMDSYKLHTRSESDIQSIVKNPATITIVIYIMKADKVKKNNETQFSKRNIAAITFASADEDNILISLCGTSDIKYDNSFGTGNDNKSFRRRGLMTILIRMACSYHLSKNKSFSTIFVLVYPDDPSRISFWIKHRFNLDSRSIFQSLGSLKNNVFITSDLPLCVGDEFVYKYGVGELLCFYTSVILVLFICSCNCLRPFYRTRIFPCMYQS